MIGPPGRQDDAGEAVPGILPPVVRRGDRRPFIPSRANCVRASVSPIVRSAPHHTISTPRSWRGTIPRPAGIWRITCCFSTEMPEFDRRVLEALRQPIEEGVLTGASRIKAAPRRFVLVAAMNPCPAGTTATTSARAAARRNRSPYGGRSSGPLRDRRSHCRSGIAMISAHADSGRAVGGGARPSAGGAWQTAIDGLRQRATDRIERRSVRR